MTKTRTISVARGDGIGPEIMDACLHVLSEAGAAIKPKFIEIGDKVYLRGHTAGIAEDTWDILRDCKVFYKAPITTPQGEGYKSLNVTIRKTSSMPMTAILSKLGASNLCPRYALYMFLTVFQLRAKHMARTVNGRC
ncbi:isocitrate/isopropylmalate family dehydrogenase [Thermodesulfovibrionales bacterium]|nr:isocitrate/isopropylmalate family dehydrogenase [Thermodesulfovibrionales bacterium]